MPARKLSNETEAEVVRRYLAGESLRSMAAGYGVKHQTLADSLRRQGTMQRTPPERNRLYSLDATTFQTIDTEAKAYWLGFLFADGSVSKRTVTLALSHKDRSHVEAFRDFMKSEAPVKDVMRLVNTLTSIVQITDRDLAADLVKLGISVGRPLPTTSLIATPPELQHHWIRGFFDGDGSAGQGRPRMSFCCPHTELLHLIRDMIAAWARHPFGSILPHSHGVVWYLTYSGINSCRDTANYLYRDATFCLQRKYDRTRKWFEPPP